MLERAASVPYNFVKFLALLNPTVLSPFYSNPLIFDSLFDNSMGALVQRSFPDSLVPSSNITTECLDGSNTPSVKAIIMATKFFEFVKD